MMATEAMSSQEAELIGGLMNAVKRGETLDQARGSFLNAGYSPQLVNMAARKLMGTHAELVPQANGINVPSSNLDLYAKKNNAPTVTKKKKRGFLGFGKGKQEQPVSTPPIQQAPQPQQMPQMQQQVQQVQPRQQVVVKRSGPPYWAVLLMILLGIGIIVGASILGLFWNQLFPPV